MTTVIINKNFQKYFKRNATKKEIAFYNNLYKKNPNLVSKVCKHIALLNINIKNNILSYSQCGQDLFVYNYFKGKKNGFYIEMGAGDGIYISNTKLLNECNWSGLLIEPSSIFESLNKNRSNDICVKELISDKIEELDFIEINDTGQCSKNNTLLSKVLLKDDNDDTDNWAKNKVDQYGKIKNNIIIKTTTLEYILDKYNCPKEIDYFSLDVEGMEYKVLKNFPFDKYKIKLLGIEHPTNTELLKILESNFIKIGKCGDDIFYKSKLV